jgi:hypothetical protein
MNGTFLGTAAPRISTPFFGNTEGALHKGFYLSEALQSVHPQLIGHQIDLHEGKYIYFPNYVNKKIRIAKKYFSFRGSDRKKAGPDRIRNAINIHSSLLNLAVITAAGRSQAGCFSS